MSRTKRLLDLMQALRKRKYPVSGATLAQELGISGSLIILAQRHRAEKTAFELLEQMMSWAVRPPCPESV